MADKPKSALTAVQPTAPQSAIKSVQPAPSQPQPSEAKKTDKPPPVPNMLKEGQVIAAQSSKQYFVEKILGKGGFGEVYKVYPVDDTDKSYAMKVEPIKCKPGNEKMLRLKIELYVFDTIAASTTVNKTHFVKMHDKGKTLDFKYYVMDLIWLSLKEVVEDICKNMISPATLITIARQTLKGIEALHELGFLHRDIKAANYAVGLPPNDNIIYLLDFGIARPYRDEKTGEVKVPRAKVPFMGTLKYASIRSMENKEQCRKDDLEVWMYMMIQLYDKKNILWGKEKTGAKILELKKTLQAQAYQFWQKRELNVPDGYVAIIAKIKDMDYKDKGDFPWFEKILAETVKTFKIDMTVPLEWVGKKPKSPEKPKREARKMPKDAESEKKKPGSGKKPAPNADFEQMITFDPPKYVTFKPIPEKQVKQVVISNAYKKAVTFKIKTVRHQVFNFKPVKFCIKPNDKQTIKVTFNGVPAGEKPVLQDRFTVDMIPLPNDPPSDWAMAVWKDPQFLDILKKNKNIKRKVLNVHYDGCEIPVDKAEQKEQEEEQERNARKAEKEDSEMKVVKTARKKESRKRRKESRKRSKMMDPDEVVITMEALKDELMRLKEKRRRQQKGGETEDDYWDDDNQDDSEDDYSDEDEEYLRKRSKERTKGRKKRSAEGRSKEMTAQTRDYSDREDDFDERDERDDRRRPRSAEGRKRSKAVKKYYEDNEDESVVGELPTKRLEPYDPDEKKDKDRKKDKDEKKPDDASKKKDKKTPEKGSKEKGSLETAIAYDDGAYMVLGDVVNAAQDSKDKKGGDGKKEQKPPAAKAEPTKKDEAAPAKK